MSRQNQSPPKHHHHHHHHLQKKSGVRMSTDRVITMDELAKHNNVNDAWIALSGKVFEVTTWIPKHPGKLKILEGCGRDGTAAFNTVHSYVNFEKILAGRQVGVLGGQLPPRSPTKSIKSTGTVGGKSVKK